MEKVTIIGDYIEIEESPQGCVISDKKDSDYGLVISSPLDAKLLIQSLTEMLYTLVGQSAKGETMSNKEIEDLTMAGGILAQYTRSLEHYVAEHLKNPLCVEGWYKATGRKETKLVNPYMEDEEVGEDG